MRTERFQSVVIDYPEKNIIPYKIRRFCRRIRHQSRRYEKVGMLIISAALGAFLMTYVFLLLMKI